MEFRYVVVVIGLLTATGCATTSELKAMQVRLDSSLSATKTSLDSRIQQLESNDKKWEELHGQVLRLIKLQEDTVAMIGKFESVDQEHDRLLTAHQDALSKLSDSVKVSTKEVTELRAVWQGEAGALANMLEAEEVRYRDGLSSLQRIRSELKSLQGGGGGSHHRKEELSLGR